MPEFWDTDFGNGTTPHLIKRFRATYIQTAYFGCNGNSCNVVFNPGEGTTSMGRSQDQLDAITGFVFKSSMLPTAIFDSGPGGSLRGNSVNLLR